MLHRPLHGVSLHRGRLHRPLRSCMHVLTTAPCPSPLHRGRLHRLLRSTRPRCRRRRHAATATQAANSTPRPSRHCRFRRRRRRRRRGRWPRAMLLRRRPLRPSRPERSRRRLQPRGMWRAGEETLPRQRRSLTKRMPRRPARTLLCMSRPSTSGRGMHR